MQAGATVARQRRRKQESRRPLRPYHFQSVAAGLRREGLERRTLSNRQATRGLAYLPSRSTPVTVR